MADGANAINVSRLVALCTVERNTPHSAVAQEGCATMGGQARREFLGTVLIADDHAVFRLGLVQLLRRSLKVKRFLEAECFAQVVEHLKDRDVSLTILDLAMPGFAGPEEITRMRLLRPDAQVVVLSACEFPQGHSRGAIGRRAWLHREESKYGSIGRETSACPVGRNLCSCSFGGALPRSVDATASSRRTEPEQKALSSRQREVLKGLVEGKSNKEIARTLNVAEGTVKIHLAALFRVLGATNRAHAAALGKQLID